jgi:hypothetical protein
VTVRNLIFNGQGKVKAPVVWENPGPGCQLQDMRVTGFVRTGVTLRQPVGEQGREVKLSKVRIHPGPDVSPQVCVTVEAGKAPARKVNLTDCRFEGQIEQGVLVTGGIDGLEVIQCRLFSLGRGVQFVNAGPLRASFESNTFARVPTPLQSETVPGPEDRLLLRFNLFFKASEGPVLFTKGGPAPKEFFKGSEGNWCNNLKPPESVAMGLISQPAIEPELELKPELKPGDPGFNSELAADVVQLNDGFLRYPRTSPFNTAAPGGKPIGVRPR